MEEAKHTQGEWIADDNHGCKEIYGGDDSICCTSGLHSEEEDNANAKLMAAAPNMLKAVQSAIKAYDELGVGKDQSCYKLALEALEKAR